MLRTLAFAGLLASLVTPAIAAQTQLERKVGVEPGLYTNAQLIQLKTLQQEGASAFRIQRILDDPQGGALVPRLSTREAANRN